MPKYSKFFNSPSCAVVYLHSQLNLHSDLTIISDSFNVQLPQRTAETFKKKDLKNPDKSGNQSVGGRLGQLEICASSQTSCIFEEILHLHQSHWETTKMEGI